MNPYDRKVPKSKFIFCQDLWFGGFDNSMKSLGSAQRVTSEDLIRSQNAAIRDCWMVIGNHLRQAMLVVSEADDVYPEELKGDALCRKMLKAKNVGA